MEEIHMDRELLPDIGLYRQLVTLRFHLQSDIVFILTNFCGGQLLETSITTWI